MQRKEHVYTYPVVREAAVGENPCAFVSLKYHDEAVWKIGKGVFYKTKLPNSKVYGSKECVFFFQDHLQKYLYWKDSEVSSDKWLLSLCLDEEQSSICCSYYTVQVLLYA